MLHYIMIAGLVVGCPNIKAYFNDGSKKVTETHVKQILLSDSQCRKTGTGDCLVELVFQKDHIYAVCGSKSEVDG